jgi:hypothetical protein
MADGQGRLTRYQSESRVSAEWLTWIMLRISLLSCAAGWPLRMSRLPEAFAQLRAVIEEIGWEGLREPRTAACANRSPGGSAR